MGGAFPGPIEQTGVGGLQLIMKVQAHAPGCQGAFENLRVQPCEGLHETIAPSVYRMNQDTLLASLANGIAHRRPGTAQPRRDQLSRTEIGVRKLAQHIQHSRGHGAPSEASWTSSPPPWRLRR